METILIKWQNRNRFAFKSKAGIVRMINNDSTPVILKEGEYEIID